MIASATGIIVAVILIFLIVFYRDPTRKIPTGNIIVSPADGKVIDVIIYNCDTSVKKGAFGLIKDVVSGCPKKGVIIAIFMRVWDVHVNRCPVDGKALSIQHKDGKFHAAQHIQFENEKNEILIKHKT